MPRTDAAHRAVEELVAHYRGKARAVARCGIAVGGVVGLAVGAVPVSPLRAAWPIPVSFAFATMLGGLVVGVLIGYVIGDTRAQLYHRMAEQARLQLELEERISRSDARLAELLQALAARAARPEPVAAPPPVRPPILTVAPAPPLSPPVSS